MQRLSKLASRSKPSVTRGSMTKTFSTFAESFDLPVPVDVNNIKSIVGKKKKKKKNQSH